MGAKVQARLGGSKVFLAALSSNQKKKGKGERNLRSIIPPGFVHIVAEPPRLEHWAKPSASLNQGKKKGIRPKMNANMHADRGLKQEKNSTIRALVRGFSSA